MRVPFHDLDRGLANVWGDLRRAQRRPVERARFLAGPEVDAFESEWAAAVGGGDAVAVASGTAALAIALRACGIGENDPVYVPAFGCPATLAAIHQVGAWPVFVDVGPDGLCGAAQFAAHARTAVKPKAVIAVHLFGRAVNVAAINAWGTTLPVDPPAVIEDACQAHGVAGVGRHGAAAAWSFYPTKPLGAWGDAGAVTSPFQNVVHAARELRDYGRPGSWEIARWGWCARMDEQQAAVLREKLRRVFRRHGRQREAAWRGYAERLPCGIRPWGDGADVAWNHHLAPVLLEGGAGFRDAVCARMGELGVQTAVHYPVCLPELGRDRYIGPGDPWPWASRWAENVLSLPMFPGLRDSEVAWVCEALERALAEVSAAQTAQEASA